MKRLLELDLNLLVALHILLDERSVTTAARRLGVTQPAASHKLRRLRESLDDPLLVPGARGLVPTERALALEGPLRESLAMLADAVVDPTPFDPRTAENTFVLGGADLFEYAVLPRLFAFLRELAPKVSLVVKPRRNDVCEFLERGDAHFAFGPRFEPRPGIRRLKLGEESFVVIGRSKHPAFRRGLTLDKYLAAEHILVSPGGATGGVVDTVLAGMNRSRRVAIQVAHFAPAPGLAAHSDLLLTAPASLAKRASQQLALSVRPPPLELPKTTTLLAWHERFDKDPAHRWLRDTARRFVT